MTENSMDFTFDEEQETLRVLAATVFAKHGTDQRVQDVERAGEPYDADLWTDLIETGLLDVVLPASVGGSDLGMVGLAIVAQSQGKHLTRVPLVSTAVAALALARHGYGDGQLLRSIREGTARVAIALPDQCNAVTAEAQGDQWALTGTLPQVYMAGSCTHVLVIVDEGGFQRAILQPLDRPGLDVERFSGMSRNIHATISFDGVVVGASDLIGERDALGGPARWIRQRFLTGLAAIETGLCREALRRTAEYTSERLQFERPLSTNQGVAMRAADAHIDTESMRLTMLDAAWNLDRGDDARTAVSIASWWAREGGFRVVHATQHLHGGMGADVDNHIHRYFLWARELDIVGGPAPALLAELGEWLGEPVSEAATTRATK